MKPHPWARQCYDPLVLASLVGPLLEQGSTPGDEVVNNTPTFRCQAMLAFTGIRTRRALRDQAARLELVERIADGAPGQGKSLGEPRGRDIVFQRDEEEHLRRIRFQTGRVRARIKPPGKRRSLKQCPD